MHNKAYSYDRDGVKLAEIDKSSGANRNVTSYTNYADGTIRQSYNRTLLKATDQNSFRPIFEQSSDESGSIIVGYSNIASQNLHYEDGRLAYSAGQTVDPAKKGRCIM
ncbi:hypothetical protein IMCC1989_1116 [gamma proteobacterium IMCC1989]|nr:hypothetical protein IMCC1989_1116 [gamma proteobacterium IMCC1989]